MAVSFTVNGKAQSVDTDANTPLLWVVREHLKLTGTKFGCGAGLCGACTVHVDGQARRSCQIKVGTVGAQKITTIEHIGETPIGAKLQDAWLQIDVMQCGYCQAGQIMSATALLAATPKPTATQINAAMAGNICRCACYNRISEAIEIAAGMSEEKPHAA